VAVIVAGCGANNIRPRNRPLVEAVLDTITAPPDVVVDSLQEVVMRRGFEIAAASAPEGFIETKWFDLDRGRSGGRYTRHPDRVIRFRFYLNPASRERSVLWSEALMRRTLDPSLPAELAEVMVPIGHPGDSLLQSVLDEIRAIGVEQVGT
jgi:hypothetical protein